MNQSNSLSDLLVKMINFDTSINPPSGQFPSNDCANFLIQHGKALGFHKVDLGECWYEEAQINPVYPVVLYKPSGNPGPTVLFLGHIDVVPVSEGEREDWQTDPFDAQIQGDFVTGRGSCDMKGGVAAFFEAFGDYDVSAGTVVIALSGDEEIGGNASMPLMVDTLRNHGLLPDYVLNAEPSSPPVIVTKRRGGTWLTYSFELDPQTTRGTVRTKKFTSQLGDGGESLHSSAYVLGADIHAMITAAKFAMDKKIVHVHSSSIKTNSVPKFVEISYVEENEHGEEVTYSAGLTGMMHALASIGSLNWPIVPSKFGPAICPNLLDYTSDSVTLTFDIRAMYKDAGSHEELREIIQDLFVQYNQNPLSTIEVKIEPVNVDPNSSLAQLVKHFAVQEGLDISDVGEKLGGASDTRFFTALGIPGVELGPIGHGAHGTNENVSLSSVHKLVTIFRGVYEKLCQDFE